MKKTLAILSIILLGAIGCTKNEFEQQPVWEGELPEGMVDITMTLDVPTEMLLATKAGERSHTPSIDDIRVAMFGTSGYTQAYTKAEPVGPVANTNYGENGNTTKYNFKVSLPVYEGEVHIHVIANGDKTVIYDGWPENKLMTRMLTTGGVGAYWARIVLDDGILPQWDSNGTMRVVDGHFVPTTETAAAFQDIELIRNFAEVKLILSKAVSDLLEDVSYTIINVPDSGYVVPAFAESITSHPKSATDTVTIYEAEYLDDFGSYTFDTATARMVNGEKTYYGYTAGKKINTALPAADVALPSTASLANADGDIVTEGVPAFVYERVFSTQDPPMIMMRGKWKADGKYYYYRLDLMDERLSGETGSAYFALYRNYQYQIRIGKIGNKGATSPTLAMARNWGGNISMTAGTERLSDISDGNSRLYVAFVDKTYITGGEKTNFYVKYEPDADGVVNNESVSIKFKKDTNGNDMNDALLPLTDGEGQPIADDEGNPVYFEKVSVGSDGAWFYRFNLKQQSSTTLESTFLVTANNGEEGDDASLLQREVTVRIMKKVDMTLSFNPEKAGWSTGSKVVLNIKVSDKLVESMFPLEFHIEDSAHILNPTGKDKSGTGAKDIEVPVKTDASLIDGSNSFYFIRTVNWSEYKPMQDAFEAGDADAIVFQTEFKTLANATETTVYVTNEFFEPKNKKLERTERTLKTGTATFTYTDFSTSKLSAKSEDGHVTLTFNKIYSVENNAIQMFNSNTTSTLSFSTDAEDCVFTGVSMDFTDYNHSLGNISANTGAVSDAVETEPFTRSWPTNGTSTSSNLVLTFTRAGTQGNRLYHRITSITVTYQYYE